MNSSKHITNCIQALNKNGVIIFPTDTIMGLGCDANDEESIQKINQLKNRNSKQGFIVLISSYNELSKYVEDLPRLAKGLIEQSNKPLSIIYPKGKNVSKYVLGDDGSIAIRVVHSGFAQDLLHTYQKPIISTSVNISGRESALAAEQVPQSILKAVDYVVNLPSQTSKQVKASTIIKITPEGKTEIIRE